MAIIDNSTNLISNIPMTDQSSTPTTPPAGLTRIYSKADGLYIVNSGGTTTGPFAASTGTMVGQDGWVSAGETWTYASADAPTFTFTVAADVTTKYSAGMRVKLTQTTVKYFIITAVSAFSAGNTTITIYGGTDYTLANAAITANNYSVVKAPLGFPMSPAKWKVEILYASDFTQASPVAGTWYNVTSLSIPIGAWHGVYEATVQISNSGGAASAFYASITLSTANNSESDAGNTYGIGGWVFARGTASRQIDLVLAAKATYYLNARNDAGSPSNLYVFGSAVAKTIIHFVSAYL